MKTLITAVILSTSLALSGNVAMAAATHKTAAATHVTRHVAKVQRRGPAQRYVALPGIFGALFGLPGVYVNSAYAGGRAAARDTGSTYDPTFDSPSPSTPIDNSASDEAAAAAAAASEQNLNDSMALTASMAAAEEQNDEANAAALQTEINAGM